MSCIPFEGGRTCHDMPVAVSVAADEGLSFQEVCCLLLLPHRPEGECDIMF